ncbi:hypothetical protein NNF59_003485 [Providencia stuartii]|nr:hypothetical protein [Providencia stuartii]
MKKVLILIVIGASITGCTFEPMKRPEYPSYRKPDPITIEIPTNANNGDWNKTINGNDLIAKFGKNPEKDLYESEVEYKERMSQLNDYVFSSSGTASVNYNPETEKLSIESAYHNAVGLMYITGYKGKDLGSYIGTNAFGVSTKVQKKEASYYHMIFQEEKDDAIVFFGIDGDCKIKPAVYRNAIGDIKVQFITKLKYPYVTINKQGSKRATISDPTDDDVTNYVFYGDLLAARLINNKTGETLPCKLKITEIGTRYEFR